MLEQLKFNYLNELKTGKRKDPGFKAMERKAAQLLTVQNASSLCRYVNLPFHQLEDVINKPNYSELVIPKKSGGKRLLEAPNLHLLSIQRHLNNGLQSYYSLLRPECCHGFVRSEKECRISIVSNAEKHIGQDFILNIDLKDFFHAISAKQVRDLFYSDLFKFNEHISAVLALLVTYKGRLPQGAPTSPVISNFICLTLDRTLSEWAELNNCIYTRYADDLTFSSNVFFTDKMVEELRSLVQDNGFIVNERKLRRKGKGRKQTVTGLIVNEKVNVDRKLIRKVRAMLNDLEINGIKKASATHFKNIEVDSKMTDFFVRRMKGYIDFIGQVRGKEDAIYIRFLQGFKIANHKIIYTKEVE